jgi:nucleotide-binding universal stress UspA family protein/GNAT superfamily N-acetyltransferase
VGTRPVTLRDGAEVVLRPIAPQDAGALRAGFERLSPRSRYRRFFSSVSRLSDRDVRYLTEVDHHDHEALVAVAANGDLVGVARFVRTGAAEAEPAIVVADDWQGRGVAGALLDALAARAREEAVEVFRAPVLAENPEAIRLLSRLGDTTTRADGREVELEIVLRPEEEAAGRLRSLLRLLAGGAHPGLALLHRLAWRPPRTELGRPLRDTIVVAVDLDVDVDVDVDFDGDAERGAAPGPVVAAAAALARALGASVELVGVRGPLLGGGEEVAAVLQATARRLRADGLRVAAHQRRGDPVASLVDVAAAQRARLIVVGAPERSAAARLLAGDVPHAVARHAPCDVLLVRGAGIAPPAA